MYLYLTFLFSNETWRVPQFRGYTRLHYMSMRSLIIYYIVDVQ